MLEIRRNLKSLDITSLKSTSHWVIKLRERTEAVFSVRPCLWQTKVSLAALKGQKNICCIAGTGSGKTLTFWMPLLLCEEGIQIVVVPLNILGKQNVDQLKGAGISSIAITGETATDDNFKDIENGKYRVVITNPEILLKQSKTGFSKLFKTKSFTAKIISVIFDEAHCISQWGSFRPEYREIGRLVHILKDVVFLLTSATLPKFVLDDVLSILHMQRSQLYIMRRSSDRHNVFMAVREIKHSLSSFADLNFLVPDGWMSGDKQPPKFLAVFDCILDCVNAGLLARSRLPVEERNRVKWHHSDMSDTYRADVFDEFKQGSLFGVFATDTLGTGMDIPDIDLVVLWRANKLSLCSLWQRVGRGARNLSREATALMFTESKALDAVRTERNEKKRRREETMSAREVARLTKDGVEREGKRLFRGPVTGKENSIPLPLERLSEVSAQHHDIAAGDTPLATASAAPVQVTMGMSVQEPHPLHRLSNPSSPPGPVGPRERGDLYHRYNRDQGTVDRAPACPRKKMGFRSAKKEAEEMDPAVEDIVNASERSLGCRRVPVRVAFDEDLVDFDHRDCAPSSAEGCTRCRPRPSRLCCDVCNPSAFCEVTTPAIQSTMSTKGERRSRLKEYTRQDFENLLWRLLDDWRETKTVEDFGILVARQYGPSLVMPQGLMERVVDCAHYDKVKSVQDLRRETGWNCPDEIASIVVALIAGHERPPPPLDVSNKKVTRPTTVTPKVSTGKGVLTSNTTLTNTHDNPCPTSNVHSQASTSVEVLSPCGSARDGHYHPKPDSSSSHSHHPKPDSVNHPKPDSVHHPGRAAANAQPTVSVAQFYGRPPAVAPTAPKKTVDPSSRRNKCGICFQSGHNKRTCPEPSKK